MGRSSRPSPYNKDILHVQVQTGMKRRYPTGKFPRLMKISLCKLPVARFITILKLKLHFFNY